MGDRNLFTTHQNMIFMCALGQGNRTLFFLAGTTGQGTDLSIWITSTAHAPWKSRVLVGTSRIGREDQPESPTHPRRITKRTGKNEPSNKIKETWPATGIRESASQVNVLGEEAAPKQNFETIDDIAFTITASEDRSWTLHSPCFRHKTGEPQHKAYGQSRILGFRSQVGTPLRVQ